MNLEYTEGIISDDVVILKNGQQVAITEVLDDLNMLSIIIKVLASMSKSLMPPIDKKQFRDTILNNDEFFDWLRKNKITG